MSVFNRLRRRTPQVAEHPAVDTSAYGPNSPEVERLLKRLATLTQDDITWLAAAYGAARGRAPVADPFEAAKIESVWKELVQLPLARIDRRDRPAPMAIEAGAEAVLAAIWATGLEPPDVVRELAASGGADLALLVTVRPEARPDQYAMLWDYYTERIPILRGDAEPNPSGR